MCADVAAEGEDCGEVYLEDLLQPIESAPLSLENRTRRLKVGIEQWERTSFQSLSGNCALGCLL